MKRENGNYLNVNENVKFLRRKHPPTDLEDNIFEASIQEATGVKKKCTIRKWS